MRKKQLAIMMLACAMGLTTGCAVKIPVNVPGNTEETQNVKAADETEEESGAATEKQSEETAGEETVQENQDADTVSEVFDNEVKENVTVNATPITIVMQGCKYVVPSDYCCTYMEGIGPVVYMSDVFQMKLGTRETPYSDLLKDIDSTDDMAEEAGYSILEKPQETKINDQSIIYFVGKKDEDKTIVVLMDAPDHQHHLGGQIVVQSDDVTNEDMLQMYLSIASTATMTDEPDSTKEEIDKQINYITGEKRESSTITYEDKTITFKVPDGFYYTSGYEKGTSSTQFFSGGKFDISYSVEKAIDEGAKHSAEVTAQYEENTEMMTYEVAGRKVYVVTYYEDYNGKTYYNMQCTCDLKDGYVVTMYADNRDIGEISFEPVKEFFEIEE